jgi:dihydroorotate dehydrogenase electron transfer subunit
VISNTVLCQAHVSIELDVPRFPPSHPGQFVQLQCATTAGHAPRALEWPAGGFPSLVDKDDWTRRRAFLRRPFSIADRWRDNAGRARVVVISRSVGPGTAWLEKLAPQDGLDITGPLGHGFEIPHRDVPVVLIGGGVGIPPLLYLSRRLSEAGRTDVTAIFGATTREQLPVRLISEPAADGLPVTCVDLPGNARFPTVITTDDGSLGMRGVVTDALPLWHAQRTPGTREDAVVFACGPEAMLQAVAKLTREVGLRCQLCIERRMGCGLGTCLSCVVRVRDASRPQGWRWALTCEEGPVFDRDQLLE